MLQVATDVSFFCVAIFLCLLTLCRIFQWSVGGVFAVLEMGCPSVCAQSGTMKLRYITLHNNSEWKNAKHFRHFTEKKRWKS